MTPSEPVKYTPTLAGELRPMSRRETIRDALDTGNWQAAAQHLHHAHQTAEWRMVAGITSHTAYIETLGISRSYDYFLRLTITTGTAQAVSTFGAARRMALETRTSPQPEG